MTKIVLKHGTGVPADSDLEVAEVAIDNVSGAMYTKLADDSVKHLNEGGASDWGSITGKPTEYPPEDHDHDGVYQPVGDYIEDADSDGKQYARQDGAWSEVVIPDGGSGSSVHIGETPPDNPEEGQQWMEVPASGDAVMWIYDGDKWLQHPSGKDGAPGQNGADGNIADATEQGVIATWDNTSQQWTPEGGVVVDASGNVGIGTDNPVGSLNGATSLDVSGIIVARGIAGSHQTDAGVFQYNPGSDTLQIRAYGSASGPAANIVFSSGSGGVSDAARMRIDANGNVGIGTDNPKYPLVVSSSGAQGLEIGIQSVSNNAFIQSYDRSASLFSEMSIEGLALKLRAGVAPVDRLTINKDGRVDITGSLYVNGVPKIGTSDLIETLHTLREATKDETTIKGLRDAIGNAVGGLIEKFEAMQSTATQEISDE